MSDIDPIERLRDARQAYQDATRIHDRLHREHDQHPDDLGLKEKFIESIIEMDRSREEDHAAWQYVRDLTEPTP